MACLNNQRPRLGKLHPALALPQATRLAIGLDLRIHRPEDAATFDMTCQVFCAEERS